MVMLGALPGQDDRLEARSFLPLSPTHAAPGYADICMATIPPGLRTAGAMVLLCGSQLSRTVQFTAGHGHHVVRDVAGTATVSGRPCRGSYGYRVPAAQVPDGLAVFPLDGVFEQVGQPPAAGNAGDVGDPAAGPDRDDE